MYVYFFPSCVIIFFVSLYDVLGAHGFKQGFDFFCASNISDWNMNKDIYIKKNILQGSPKPKIIDSVIKWC
jgi:hypothetical protein